MSAGGWGFLWVSKTLLGGPILYISAVLPLWSAFAEKVRILTFVQSWSERFAFTQQPIQRGKVKADFVD